MSKRSDNSVISPSRKRLMNLYMIGKEVTFEDESGEFSVWLQKINPWQEREAIAKSKIVRAPIMALKRDRLDPDRVQYTDLLVDWGMDNKDAQIAFLISPKVQQARDSAEAKIAFEDQWAKDDYLITLQEAWNSGMADVFALDPEDKEASRIYGELRRYTDQVDAEVEYEANEYALDMQDKDEAKIEQDVLDILIDAEADALQMAEFRRWQMFYAVRNPDDHDALFFEGREDVDVIDPKIFIRLLEEYSEMTVDGLEGKD